MGDESRKSTEPAAHDGDTAERERYQVALHESEERFRRLAEACYEGVVIMENDHVIDANPQAAAMLGYTLAEYIGLPVEAVVAPESRVPAREHQRSDAERPWEGWALHKNGSRVLVEVRVRRVRSGQRVVVFRDVGEQRAMEERLRETEKMQVIGRLAGSVAHDFNNLLTIILGCGHLLERDLPYGDPSRLLAAEITAAGERAAALTRQLLAFSRKQVRDLRVLDLNEVIGGVALMLERLLGEDTRVSMQLAPKLPLVRADVGQIEQILMNLCTNSRDAMPDGGEIVVATRACTIDSGNEHAGQWVHLAVTDSGVGMDAATLARAFEPLFTTKEVGRGTGLGLSTVQAIVTQNGGRVTIASNVARGTTVEVWLPALGSAEPIPEPSPVEKAVPRGTEVVLLVEDDSGVRALCEGVLTSLGYTVLVATAADAERTARAHSGAIDLLLSDVVMPGIRGPAVADRIRALSPSVRVLFVSGYSDEFLSGNVRGASFLGKPFTPADLGRKVREVLDG
jgi:two-component system, cell cycle sensor histidine kinase and response regulator CckA